MKRLILVLVCSVVLFSGCKEKATELAPGAKAEAESLASEAQFAMTIREFSRAEELAQRAIKIREDYPEYWVTLGMARRRQDNTDGARKAYKKALALHVEHFKDKKDTRDLAQQAWVLGLLGKKADALKLLEQARKDFPNDELIKRMADPRGLAKTFELSDFKALAL